MLAISTRLSFGATAAAAAGACLLASLAACDVGSADRADGTTATPAPSAAPTTRSSTALPDDGPVADGDLDGWVEGVCAAALPAYELLDDVDRRLSSGAEGEDPDQLFASQLAAMKQIAAAFEQTVADVRALGPAPVAGGNTISHAFSQLFSTTGHAFNTAAVALDNIDRTAPGALEDYETAVRNFSLQASRTGDALRDRFESPELEPAYDAASSCQRLAPWLAQSGG